MTRHLLHATGGLLALVSLKFLGFFSAIDWTSAAQQFVLILGILCVGIPGAWTYVDRFRLKRRKEFDDAAKELWQTKAIEAVERAEKADRESRVRQDEMNRKLDEIQRKLEKADIRNDNLNQQLIEATSQHIQAEASLRIAGADIVRLTEEIARLRLGVKAVQEIGAKVDKVDRHVKQVAKAMNESDTLPSVEMDSDVDGENAGGPVTGAN